MRALLVSGGLACLVLLVFAAPSVVAGSVYLAPGDLGARGTGPFTQCQPPHQSCEEHRVANGMLCPQCPTQGDCCLCEGTVTGCAMCNCDWAWDWWCQADVGDLCGCGFVIWGECVGGQCIAVGPPSYSPGNECGLIWPTCCKGSGVNPPPR